MPLTNLIALIAEVAAKRTAQEGKAKEETPGSVPPILSSIWTRLRPPFHNFLKMVLYLAQADLSFSAYGDSV